MMECGKRQVAVIGGGAAGLAAAVAAARCGAETTLYEAMTRPGRKLLITGNGRCNLCNKRAGDGGAYAGMNGTDAAELAASVFARFSADGRERAKKIRRNRNYSRTEIRIRIFKYIYI
jgi:predicted flavoprotein YhiN